MARKNRWHPVLLPDDYIRKMKQDLSEVEAQVESETRYEPDPDFSPPPDDEEQLSLMTDLMAEGKDNSESRLQTPELGVADPMRRQAPDARNEHGRWLNLWRGWAQAFRPTLAKREDGPRAGGGLVRLQTVPRGHVGESLLDLAVAPAHGTQQTGVVGEGVLQMRMRMPGRLRGPQKYL